MSVLGARIVSWLPSTEVKLANLTPRDFVFLYDARPTGLPRSGRVARVELSEQGVQAVALHDHLVPAGVQISASIVALPHPVDETANVVSRAAGEAALNRLDFGLLREEAGRTMACRALGMFRTSRAGDRQ